MNRRRFVKLAVGAGALAVGGRAWYFATRETWALRVVREEIPLPNLPPAFDGLRVGHLSDLHVGRHVHAEFVNRALDMAAGLGAELIVLTGDYASWEWTFLEGILPALARLRAPLGVYAVLGNHDYMRSQQAHVVPALASAGVRVLDNEAVKLALRDDAMYLVGIADPVTGHQDFDRAVKHVPEGARKVFLAHTPDVIPTVHALGGDLLLAGHTHGGQISFPFIGPPVVPSVFGARFAAGLAQYEGTPVFVTRGVGVIDPYLRFRCPPEVALLTLCRDTWELPEGDAGTDLRFRVRQMSRAVRLLHRLKHSVTH